MWVTGKSFFGFLQRRRRNEIPSITTKRIFDQYQQTKGIDLWSCHYEIMKEDLEKLKEMNIKIRREIRQRMGQCLNDLSFQDLQSLESDMESAWRVIHDRAVRYSAQLTAFLGF
ncbi:hypothetical protein OIU84_013757 [Salix udensis]|uniref:K-box domain-containing protein n=1 Tax=Salix udensis TaxID=889485 RepID=A0AAD6NV37_9ROSI|nr:hypothetical protein OIU84_013757 [Salix udensis]